MFVLPSHPSLGIPQWMGISISMPNGLMTMQFVMVRTHTHAHVYTYTHIYIYIYIYTYIINIYPDSYTYIYIISQYIMIILRITNRYINNYVLTYINPYEWLVTQPPSCDRSGKAKEPSHLGRVQARNHRISPISCYSRHGKWVAPYRLWRF